MTSYAAVPSRPDVGSSSRANACFTTSSCPTVVLLFSPPDSPRFRTVPITLSPTLPKPNPCITFVCFHEGARKGFRASDTSKQEHRGQDLSGTGLSMFGRKSHPLPLNMRIVLNGKTSGKLVGWKRVSTCSPSVLLNIAPSLSSTIRFAIYLFCGLSRFVECSYVSQSRCDFERFSNREVALFPGKGGVGGRAWDEELEHHRCQGADSHCWVLFLGIPCRPRYCPKKI